MRGDRRFANMMRVSNVIPVSSATKQRRPRQPERKKRRREALPQGLASSLSWDEGSGSAVHLPEKREVKRGALQLALFSGLHTYIVAFLCCGASKISSCACVRALGVIV